MLGPRGNGVKRLRGEGKDMVPETPPTRNHVGQGLTAGLFPDHLIQLVDAQSTGVWGLEDAWILIWGGVERTGHLVIFCDGRKNGDCAFARPLFNSSALCFAGHGWPW
jgi:hypothetical protein